MAEPASPTLEARRAQTFPILAPDEIARMRRFGAPCRYAAGARIYETGKPTPGMLVVLSGTIRVTGRDGHGHDFPVVDHVAGAFSGELGQLSSRRSLVDAVAVGDVEALLISPEQLHALLIAEAALGEKVMRALILRRVALIETGTGGPVLIGAASLGDVARLGNFLRRNGIPHLLLDPASDLDAQAFIDRYAPRVEDLPLVVCPDGSVLRNPTESALAKCIGMLDTASGADRVYDVAVAGARYRRPDCSNLKAMEGRGVWYWASPIEAKMCAGQEVVLVGGGNSAGQAAVFLAGYASKVWMLVRGASLAASMSKYLIERITGIANIELRTRTEISGLSGEPQSGVESVTWRHRDTSQKETRPIRHVFMFLGADPTTEWLKDCDVAVDDKGFVTSGKDARLPLETSVPGGFAIGDVRAGSVKRVGGAIGEGAAAAGRIHACLARRGATGMAVAATP